MNRREGLKERVNEDILICPFRKGIKIHYENSFAIILYDFPQFKKKIVFQIISFEKKRLFSLYQGNKIRYGYSHIAF